MERATDLGTTLRELAPQVLGALVRHHGHFDACEDAVQDALLDATVVWSERGIPESPKGWLITVASRRLADRWRSDTARRRREATVAALESPEYPTPPAPAADDTLALLFLCCHPALSPPSQVALTLRAVGGLTTAEIARRVPRPRDDHGATDQPGQGADLRRRRPVRLTRA
jgi:predicted RNA polymerase sigma factor